MTSDGVRIRARLASALDDVDAIETRPIEEVRAELSRLGIDPQASIALAEKLARGAAADPATQLLEEIERAEDVDAEIAALETAPLDEVKAALPPGVQASALAAARWRADPVEDLTAARRRRRFSTLGYGGSLIGIAASVLLFIAVRPDRLEQADQPLSTALPRPPVVVEAESVDVLRENRETRAEAIAPSPRPEIATTQKAESAERALDQAAPASKDARLSDVADAELAREDVRSRQQLEEAATAAHPGRVGLDSARAKEAPLDLASRMAASKTTALEPPPIPAPKPELPESDGALQAMITEQSTLAPTVAASSTALIEDEAHGIALPDDVTAVLLVDAVRAPSFLKDLADDLPEHQLAVRLGDARARSSGRAVIALIAFVRDGEQVEAVLVERLPAEVLSDVPAQAVAGLTAFTENAPALIEGPEQTFELIELPAGR